MSTTEIISAALIQSLWQDAVVALALWAALRAFRRSSANVRYLLSCAALAAMVVWPVASSIPLVPPVASATTSSAARTSPGAAITAAGILRSMPVITATICRSSIAPVQRLGLPVWIVGVMLFSLRAVGAGTHAFLLARRGTPADAALVALVAKLARRIGVSRRVRVL